MPVEPATLAAFAVAAVALVISPGPDTLLILRYGLSGGQRAGFAAVAGVQLGLLVHTALAVAGISVLIASSPVLFKGLALAGAGYLAWLGIQGLRSTRGIVVGDRPRPVGTAKACRDAVVTNVLNPKVILLFLALFPNFLVLGRSDVTAQLWTLSAVLILINVLWQLPLVWATKLVRRWLGDERVQRAISRISGAILLLFAGLMLHQNLG